MSIPSLNSNPISMVCTNFHYLIMKSDRIQAVSCLDGELVEEMVITKSDGSVRALVLDSVKNTPFLLTEYNIFKFTITNEDRYAWSIFLDRANSGDEKYFAVASSYCQSKVNILIVYSHLF